MKLENRNPEQLVPLKSHFMLFGLIFLYKIYKEMRKVY